MQDYANAMAVEKRDWRQWLLQDEGGREISFKNAPGRYMTEMRRLLETGTLGKCTVADVPGQEAAHWTDYRELHAMTNWSGLIEHSLDKLLRDLRYMETGGSPTMPEVVKKYRGMIVGSVSESSQAFPLINGFVCRYSMRGDEGWVLGLPERTTNRPLGRDDR